MENLKKKLEIIYNFIKENHTNPSFKINYREPEITCHLGDLYEYFKSSFELLEPNYSLNNYQQNMFQVIGILQTIYIQQDFITELNRILNLNKPSDDLRAINREIRNEFIGHPIRKKKTSNNLNSSVYIKQVNYDSLQYLRYKPSEDYSEQEIEIITVQLEEVLQRHKIYLDKSFNELLVNINNKINQYKKKLLQIQNVKKDNIDIESKLKIVFHNMPTITNQDDYTNLDFLTQLIPKQSEHERYKYYINNFIEESLSYARSKLIDLDDYLHEIEKFIRIQIDDITIDFKHLYTIDVDKKPTIEKWHIDLLEQKHSLWQIGFRAISSHFAENKIITQELEFLAKNKHNNEEYKISMRYLKWLIYNKF